MHSSMRIQSSRCAQRLGSNTCFTAAWRGRSRAAKTAAAVERDESREFAIATASILNDVKCLDIVALDVSPIASWTSYMVFCSVFSKPQLMAAMARVEKMAAEVCTLMARHGLNAWGTAVLNAHCAVLCLIMLKLLHMYERLISSRSMADISRMSQGTHPGNAWTSGTRSSTS